MVDELFEGDEVNEAKKMQIPRLGNKASTTTAEVMKACNFGWAIVIKTLNRSRAIKARLCLDANKINKKTSRFRDMV